MLIRVEKKKMTRRELVKKQRKTQCFQAVQLLLHWKTLYIAKTDSEWEGKSIGMYFFDVDQLIDSRSTSKGQLLLLPISFSQ